MTSDRTMQELLAQEFYMFVRRQIGAEVHSISPEDVRPAFALALELLEQEGLIPGAAPGLRDISAPRRTYDVQWRRKSAATEALECRSLTAERFTSRLRNALREGPVLIEAVAPAAASGAESPITDRLKSALRLQGVDLGPDATAEVVRALGSLGETAS